MIAHNFIIEYNSITNILKKDESSEKKRKKNK